MFRIGLVVGVAQRKLFLMNQALKDLFYLFRFLMVHDDAQGHHMTELCLSILIVHCKASDFKLVRSVLDRRISCFLKNKFWSFLH